SCHRNALRTAPGAITMSCPGGDAMLIRRSIFALAAAVALGQPALADTVILKNGREIHGRLIEERRDAIVMRVEGGGTMPIRKADIASFFEGEVLVDYGGP